MVFLRLLIESFSPKLLLTHGIFNLYFRNLNKWLCPIYSTFEVISTTCKKALWQKAPAKFMYCFTKTERL